MQVGIILLYISYYQKATQAVYSSYWFWVSLLIYGIK